MRYFLSFFLILALSFPTYAQKVKGNITWQENKKLKWNDFKGRANRASSFQAQTSAGINFEIDYSGNLVTITTECIFQPKKSWTKTKKNDALLKHEQLHFDISELFARRLRKELLNTKYKSDGQKLMNKMMSIYKKKIKELSKFQRAYDAETKHSTNITAQKEWEKKVYAELKKLKKYSETEVVIELK